LATLLRSGPVGQTILAGLLVFSIYTWAVILTKVGMLRRAERSCEAFLNQFRAASTDWLRTNRGTPVAGPLGTVYEGGLREFRAQRRKLGAPLPLSGEARNRIEAALEIEVAQELSRLERGHLILAIAASACPFIGLFGTVWGIMNAFRGISAEGSAGIAAVAPGVAEALVTTVAGLAVAIPAVISYNLLSGRVRRIEMILDRFAWEFLRVIDHSEEDARPLPTPEGEGETSSPVFARRQD
jgi:biopolymer transport protein TolQ